MGFEDRSWAEIDTQSVGKNAEHVSGPCDLFSLACVQGMY